MIRLMPVFWLVLFCDSINAQPIRLNSTPNNPNEMSIAVNPMDGKYMVAAANIHMVYLSSDSGRTWKEKVLKSSMGVYGDPVVKYDALGRLYIAHLANSKVYNRIDEKFYQSLDRIVVQISFDNGQTFSDGYHCGFTKGRMQDKPWIAFDKQNYIYISWTEFDQYGSNHPKHKSRIRIFKTDITWTDTITRTISDIEGNCVDDDSSVEGATIAFGKNGEIYCAWAAFHHIYIDCSKDGGKTWGKDQAVTVQKGGWTIDVPHIYRTNGLPFLKNDKQGRLYIVFSEHCTNYDSCTQTCLLCSTDGGVNWTLLRYLDMDKLEPGHFSFTPNITYSEISDKLGMVFYETLHSPSGMYAKVIEAEYQVATGKMKYHILTRSFPLPGKSVFFGDYIDISPANDAFSVSWNQPDSQEMAAYVALVNDDYKLKNLYNDYNPFRAYKVEKQVHLMMHLESFISFNPNKVKLRCRVSGTQKFKKLKVIDNYRSEFQEDLRLRINTECEYKFPYVKDQLYYDFELKIEGQVYIFNHIYLPLYTETSTIKEN